MKEKGILYKYRSLDNFKNFIDIILYNRLYAANYKDLNDPQEGQYYYRKGELNKDIRDKLYNEKGNYKICSLSKTKDNQLMWSHYANGNKGVVIGVEIDDAVDCVPVEYSGLVTIRDDDYDNKSALEILKRKLEIWEYEQEVRVFKRHGQYITVKVHEVILGRRVEEPDASFIQNLVKAINPNIKVIREND